MCTSVQRFDVIYVTWLVLLRDPRIKYFENQLQFRLLLLKSPCVEFKACWTKNAYTINKATTHFKTNGIKNETDIVFTLTILYRLIVIYHWGNRMESHTVCYSYFFLLLYACFFYLCNRNNKPCVVSGGLCSYGAGWTPGSVPKVVNTIRSMTKCV